jgi:Flp pilus assembly protein TadD
MLDCSWGDLDPGRHHLTSILLHAANAVLLFLALQRLTGYRWRSAFVAGLFAVHPLHVESVAWVAERKDVLSTFFWLLTMLAYARYAESGVGGRGTGRRSASSVMRYALVALFFALGLMSKPMLVSLPLVLLMLDWWPLHRLRIRHENTKAGRSTKRSGDHTGHESDSKSISCFRPFRAFVIEKTPLFALALASCVVTFAVQRMTGSVFSTDVYPMGVRLANAVVAYVAYLVKMVWPAGLACFYPHPGPNLPVWQTVASGAALAAVTIVAVALARRKPYVFVGWMWYLVTLIPVIGLVQVGRQAMADRYTYVPLIGVFIIVAWAVGDLAAGSRRRLTVASAVACVVLAALSVSAFAQVGYWRDSVTLFGRAVSVTKDNGLANYNLGCALKAAGDDQAGRRYVRRALRLLPDDPRSSNSFGCDLLNQGMVAEAIGCFERAIEGDPRFEEAYCNLGIAYAQAGNTTEAIRSLRKALELNPRDEMARRNLRIVEERARGE